MVVIVQKPARRRTVFGDTCALHRAILHKGLHHVSAIPKNRWIRSDQGKRRITISIDTSAAPHIILEQDFLSSDVATDMTIADLKGYIESETGVPVAAQNISYNGRVLQDETKTLQQCEVSEDSMLGMHVRRVQVSGSSTSRAGPAQATGVAQHPTRDQAETIRLQAAGDPAVLARLGSFNPNLAESVNDPSRFHQLWEEIQRRQHEMQAEKERRMTMLEADPFNVDAQREIEEMIRQEQVTENLQSAMEHNPEGEISITDDFPSIQKRANL